MSIVRVASDAPKARAPPTKSSRFWEMRQVSLRTQMPEPSPRQNAHRARFKVCQVRELSGWKASTTKLELDHKASVGLQKCPAPRMQSNKQSSKTDASHGPSTILMQFTSVHVFISPFLGQSAVTVEIYIKSTTRRRLAQSRHGVSCDSSSFHPADHSCSSSSSCFMVLL